MRRIVGSIIIGTVVMHALGYLIFDVATADFYAANTGA